MKLLSFVNDKKKTNRFGCNFIDNKWAESSEFVSSSIPS